MSCLLNIIKMFIVGYHKMRCLFRVVKVFIDIASN